VKQLKAKFEKVSAIFKVNLTIKITDLHFQSPLAVTQSEIRKCVGYFMDELHDKNNRSPLSKTSCSTPCTLSEYYFLKKAKKTRSSKSIVFLHTQFHNQRWNFQYIFLTSTHFPQNTQPYFFFFRNMTIQIYFTIH